MDLKPLIKEVLEKGYLMSLGTQDDGGVWVADVIYVHDDDLNIYWISDPDVRHSQAIAKNPQIAGTITASGAGESNLGIQFAGTVEKLEGQNYELAVKHLTKRKKQQPYETQDILQGDSWYKITLKFVDLIHEQHFGFKKQKLEL